MVQLTTFKKEAWQTHNVFFQLNSDYAYENIQEDISPLIRVDVIGIHSIDSKSTYAMNEPTATLIL